MAFAFVSRKPYPTLDQLAQLSGKIDMTTEWLPIDTAPKDGTKFLGWAVDENINVMWYSDGDIVREGDMNNYFASPMYWTLLQDPPA